MDWKTLATTFGAIFVAELGDKTQLATLILAADARTKWAVFVGSALALVATSAIAVLAGAAVTRVIPPHWLRRIAGAVFIALGGAALAAFDVRPPVHDVIVGFSAIALVSALPIAVAGLGTGQLAFVYLFRHSAGPETLLAASLALSAGLIVLRIAIGASFAREFARVALAEARGAPS